MGETNGGKWHKRNEIEVVEGCDRSNEKGTREEYFPEATAVSVYN